MILRQSCQLKRLALPRPLNPGDTSTVLQKLLNSNHGTVSKVVDENGQSLVVYHGTSADFSTSQGFGLSAAAQVVGRDYGLRFVCGP